MKLETLIGQSPFCGIGAFRSVVRILPNICDGEKVNCF